MLGFVGARPKTRGDSMTVRTSRGPTPTIPIQSPRPAPKAGLLRAGSWPKPTFENSGVGHPGSSARAIATYWRALPGLIFSPGTQKPVSPVSQKLAADCTIGLSVSLGAGTEYPRPSCDCMSYGVSAHAPSVQQTRSNSQFEGRYRYPSQDLTIFKEILTGQLCVSEPVFSWIPLEGSGLVGVRQAEHVAGWRRGRILYSDIRFRHPDHPVAP